MITYRVSDTEFPHKDSWLSRMLPARAQNFFFSRFSARYEDVPCLPLEDASEEMIVGYESSWPEAYKQMR